MFNIFSSTRSNIVALVAFTLVPTFANIPHSWADERSEFIRNIEKQGFSGKLFDTGFGAGDVKFRPDGTFTGTLYWRHPRGNTSMKGSLNGWTMIIDEVGPAGRNRAPFGAPCRVKAEIKPGTASAEGVIANCEMVDRGPKIRLTFKSKSPRDPVADAAVEAAQARKDAEEKAREADKPRTEAIFSVASARFVQEHCTGLSVNFSQMNEVVQSRGMTVPNAEASADYKKYHDDWGKALRQNGPERLCREFQLTFASPSMSRDMIRLISLGQSAPLLPTP